MLQKFLAKLSIASRKLYKPTMIVEIPKSRLLRRNLVLITSGFYDAFTGANLVQTAKGSTIVSINLKSRP